MKLKDFLLLWTDNELIEVIFRSSSNGAYTAAELLKRGEYLDKTVSGAEVHVGKIDDFIAEDSLFRDDIFEVNKEKELPYICLELCE